MHPCDALVEDHRVCDDSAGHAAGLRNVFHSQQPGNYRGDIRPKLRHLFQPVGGLSNASLKRLSRLSYCLLRYGYKADEVCQVAGGAIQPSRFGEATAVFVQDAVGKAGCANSLPHVVGFLHGYWIAQCNGLPQWSSVRLGRLAPTGRKRPFPLRGRVQTRLRRLRGSGLEL